MRIATIAGVAIQSYRDLQAWRLAMDLVVTVYELAAQLPREERYGVARADIDVATTKTAELGRILHGLHHAVERRLNAARATPDPDPRSLIPDP